MKGLNYKIRLKIVLKAIQNMLLKINSHNFYKMYIYFKRGIEKQFTKNNMFSKLNM